MSQQKRSTSKIFIVAGELSGDKLGAWYIKHLQKGTSVSKGGTNLGDGGVHAVGGSFLKEAGAVLYERIEKLNFVGVVEIIKHLRFILRFIKRLAHHIVDNNFDELVVVDFPGFNLRLIKKVKKLNPNIKITYLSPPQVWIWGKGRVKTIKKYCDDVIVLYPFEVEWYGQHGVEARWLGYPFYDELKPYFGAERGSNIAVIPGSRSIEIKRLLPLFLRVVKRLKMIHPEIKVVVPLAESVDKNKVEMALRRSNIGWVGQDILMVQGKEEKLRALSTCSLALTKPGTNTLELALLGVPAIVTYKASWITYWIARMLVNVPHMSLPNLLLKEEVFPEFIQGDCREKKIFSALRDFYEGSVSHDFLYAKRVERLGELRRMLLKE